MTFDWRSELARRPWWANALLAFCAYMTFVYLPWDFFWKPLEHDQEVWFGFLFTGWDAKRGEVLHWLVYAAGAYGLWHVRPWIWAASAVYAAQISFGMLVWNLFDDGGGGIIGAVVAAPPFAALAAFLWLRGRPAAETS